MPNELKPCPLCGNKVEDIKITSVGALDKLVEQHYGKIKCVCGLTFEKEWITQKALDGYVKLSPDIVTAWNQRIDEEDIVYCEDCKFLQYGECRVLGIKAGGCFYCYLGERKEE